MCVYVCSACVQAVGAGLQSVQLLTERDRAVAALDEATKAATAAQQDAARCAYNYQLGPALYRTNQCGFFARAAHTQCTMSVALGHWSA